MNLTLSVSFSCNSRCKTCNVYNRKSQELSLEEWTKIFQSLKQPPFWVTISGGEPFLYKDIDALVGSLYDNCRPAIINIPTNGLLYERIPIIVKQIAGHCIKSQIVINLSIDEIEERHDAIRGVPGNYRKALKTYAALKAIDAPNLTVGLHTVISKFNAQRIPEIYAHLRALKPDSYVTEIAEERAELGTIGAEITPSVQYIRRCHGFAYGADEKRSFQPYRTHHPCFSPSVLSAGEENPKRKTTGHSMLRRDSFSPDSPRR